MNTTVVSLDWNYVHKYFNRPVIGTKEFAEEIDKNDPLKYGRYEFELPNGIYLCGNSLGPLPKRTRYVIKEELDKWSKIGVEGHFNGNRPWGTIDDKSESLLCNILGCNKSEVAIMNGLTVNCNLLFISFYQPTKKRYKILIESEAFCSDHHMVRSHIKLHNLNISDTLIELSPNENKNKNIKYIETNTILNCIEKHKNELALVWLGGLQYYTGQLFEMSKISFLCNKYDIICGFDLAHAVGNVPLYLHEWNIDFATFCTYKYLNSGPGGIGGIFVHSKHNYNNKILNKRLLGWWGQLAINKFGNMNSNKHIAKIGASGWKLSNPPVLQVISLDCSLEIINNYGIKNLREKSLLLTNYLEYLLLNNKIINKYINIITPSNQNQRGCQLSLIFNINIDNIYKYITNKGIICDVRKPYVMRIAPNPLYNTFIQVWNFCKILQDSIINQINKKQKKLHKL